MTITVDGKQLKFRWNFAAQYEHEAVTGVPFDGSKTMHRHLMYWCMLRVNNRDEYTEDFDKFVERLNDDPALVSELEHGFLTIMQDRQALVESAAKSEGDKKKD